MIFRPELAEKIMRGEKTATRRRANSNPRSPWWTGGCSYDEGQIFAIQPGRGKSSIGLAEVTRIGWEQLGKMTTADYRAEGFPDGESFLTAWCAINGFYTPSEFVHVVEFKARTDVATIKQR